MTETNKYPIEVVYVFFSNTNGGVKEVCHTIIEGFNRLNIKVVAVNTFLEGLKLIWRRLSLKSERSSIAITNLHFGLFGLFFRNSIFILHGFPQRRHSTWLNYQTVVYGHRLFALCNSYTVAVSYLTKFCCENFYAIRVKSVIHNVVPKIFFEKPSSKLQKTQNSLIYIGRVIPEKGVEVMFRAVEKLRKTGFDVEFNIVGDGSMLNYLKSTYTHTSNNFFGYVSPSEKVELLNNNHTFISLHPAEPFGVTALEASLSGCVCCVSATGGHNEFVPSNQLMLINDVESEDNIAAAIKQSFGQLVNNYNSNSQLTLSQSVDGYFATYATQFLNIFQRTS